MQRCSTDHQVQLVDEPGDEQVVPEGAAAKHEDVRTRLIFEGGNGVVHISHQ
jgi:hypothetical protein